MKILKLLSKFLLILFLSIIFFKSAVSNEPVDIWNIEKEKIDNNSVESESLGNLNDDDVSNSETDIFNMQSKKKIIR